MATALCAWRLPSVLVEHAPQLYPRRSRWRDVLLSRLKRRATRWVAVSGSSAHALESLWHLAPGTIGVVLNGVEMPVPEAPGEAIEPLFSGNDVVLGVGDATAAKGFDTFCRVALETERLLPHLRFVWVGAGSGHRDGNVFMVPWADSLGWMMRHATLFFLPSRTEGLPLVLLEAWALGLPVAARAVGGVPEIVEDGVNGVLLTPNCTTGWAGVIAHLVADPAMRERLGRNGHESWRAAFTAEAMARRYGSVIEEALGDPSKRFRRWVAMSGHP